MTTLQVLPQTPMGIALVLASLLSTVVGLFIGYQAYRGFRRNHSTPMRFLSLGLLLLATSYGLAFTGTMLLRQGTIPLQYQNPIRLGVRLVQLTGLSCILYSLYRRP